MIGDPDVEDLKQRHKKPKQKEDTIAGFADEQINSNLFPLHPNDPARTVLVGTTPRGWALFEDGGDGRNNDMKIDDCDKWHSRRLQKITASSAIQITYKDLPNEVRIITGWSRR